MSEFTDGLSDEHKGNEYLGTIADGNAAAKILIDNKAYASQSIRLPADGDSQEVRTKAIEKVGKHFPEFKRPTKVDEYGDKLEYEIEGGAKKTFEGDNFKSLRDQAHKHGLTKGQFDGLAKDMAIKGDAAEATRLQKLNAGWRDLTVAEGTGFSATMSRLKQFIVAQDMPTEWVDQIGAQTFDPVVAKALLRISAQFEEGKSLPGPNNTAVNQGPLSKDTARQRLIEIDRTPNHAFKPDLMAEKMKLFAIINEEII